MKRTSGFLRAFSALKSILFSKKVQIDNITIQGSEEFLKKVSVALELLKERDLEVYKITNESLDWIIEGQSTMLSLTRWGGTLSLGGEQVDSSQTWLAGLLAYQGSRSGLYLENLSKNSNSHKVPKEFYSGDKVWNMRYESLQRLGASYEELKRLADFIETK